MGELILLTMSLDWLFIRGGLPDIKFTYGNLENKKEYNPYRTNVWNNQIKLT